jgi:predicted nucleic acid-binding protein
MIERGGSFVLDASVGIKLLVPEPGSAEALALVHEAWARRGTVHVPALFHAECASGLWKRTRAGGLTPPQALAQVEDLLALDLRVTPLAALVRPALDLATALDISVYDACYVALAGLLDLPLVTADARLVRRLEDAGRQARLLGA